MIQRHLWWLFHHLPAHTTICKSIMFSALCSFSQVLRLSCESFWHLPWIGKPSVNVMSFFLFFFFPPRTASHMNDAQHSASGKSCLECSPTSTFSFSFLFPSLSVFFAPLCLHLIFNMIGKKTPTPHAAVKKRSANRYLELSFLLDALESRFSPHTRSN